MDDEGSGQHPIQLDLEVASIVDMVFVLDGQYLVAIVNDGEELELVETGNGKRMWRLEVHSKARVIRTCFDDRTVAVGCEDGRVVAFVVIADSTEFAFESIPSRKKITGLDNN